MQIAGAILPGQSGCRDLRIEGDRIAWIGQSVASPSCVVIPTVADAHVHLDKGFTVQRAGHSDDGLLGAIALMTADKPNWTRSDLLSRMTAGLQSAYLSGTSVLRTHIDWDGPTEPLAWSLIGDLANVWRDKLILQRASLIGIDHVFDAGPGIAETVARTGGVLGFFVLGNDDLDAKLAQAFSLAVRHDLALDFHVDETLDDRADGLGRIAGLTIQHGWQGRVICGHACSLSCQPAAQRQRILELCAEAGIHLISLPTTNHYLQDRNPGRTPIRRGLLPIHESRAAGVPVSIASDNCADPFYPFGTFDLLDAFRLALVTGHLEVTKALEAITDAPRRAMGMPPATISVGAIADLIILEAPDLHSAFGNSGTTRHVVRKGTLVTIDRSQALYSERGTPRSGADAYSPARRLGQRPDGAI